MNHIDEHILELYVLGSEKVKSQRPAVEEHLLVCHGCRELVEKIRLFYADADEELKSLEKAQPEATTALARKRLEITPFEEWISPPLPRYPLTRFERLQRIVRRHPIVTGAGSFAAVAVAAALIDFFALPKKDTNPTAYLYNTAGKKLEIINRAGDKLWSIPDLDAEWHEKEDRERTAKITVVTDVDGDRTNEILTTILPPENEYGGVARLRVLEPSGKLRFEKAFTEKFSYLGRSYSPDFAIELLFVLPYFKERVKEILASARSVGRSPAIIARLDAGGNTIGKYWHFGGLSDIDTIKTADHRRELVITGINDTADSTMGEFAFVAVLDPCKIVGDKKSSACPGFRFEVSQAESYYLKLPTTEVNVLIKKNVAGMRIEMQGNNRFSVLASGGGGEYDLPAFYYYFSNDMHVIEVKSSNVTDRFYSKLHDDGKISYIITSEYLENLKNGVRYWDGKRWRKEVVRVNHE